MRAGVGVIGLAAVAGVAGVGGVVGMVVFFLVALALEPVAVLVAFCDPFTQELIAQWLVVQFVD